MAMSQVAGGTCMAHWRLLGASRKLMTSRTAALPAPHSGWVRWKRTVPAPQPPRPTGADGSRRLVVVAARDPYEVLGVPRTASMNDIKRAYRKKALKLHPDVNKSADAKERFMECKNAYQQLLDRKEQRGSAAGRGKTAAADGWGNSWGSGRGYGSSAGTSSGSYGSAGARPPPQESSYGFGDLSDLAGDLIGLAVGLGRRARRKLGSTVSSIEDFIRDLEKEFSEYSKEKTSASGSSGKMKGLWEELADIGEEFVDFLEQELGLSDDDSGSTKQQSSVGGSSSGASSSSTGARGSQQRPGATGAAASGYQEPPRPQKSKAEEVEDELQALKKKLGL